MFQGLRLIREYPHPHSAPRREVTAVFPFRNLGRHLPRQSAALFSQPISAPTSPCPSLWSQLSSRLRSGQEQRRRQGRNVMLEARESLMSPAFVPVLLDQWIQWSRQMCVVVPPFAPIIGSWMRLLNVSAAKLPKYAFLASGHSWDSTILR